MSRFDQYLKLLVEMSLDKALEVFGLQTNDLGNIPLVKTTFRKLSKANHPDHGGDDFKGHQLPRHLEPRPPFRRGVCDCRHQRSCGIRGAGGHGA